jgi:SAM-dependent methyltransferase
MLVLTHRQDGYALLEGTGLEIGALHEPAAVPLRCSVEYFDALDERRAAELYPEIAPELFVIVDHIGDLDAGGLASFPVGRFDFVIINHVLEHLANPVKTLSEVFRITRKGGTVILSVPDKEFTFDRERPLTTFEHLWADYVADTRENGDDHYLEMIQSAAPEVLQQGPSAVRAHVDRARARREHAHVWTSDSFRAFLEASLERLGIEADRLYESTAAANEIEYYSVWRKR